MFGELLDFVITEITDIRQLQKELVCMAVERTGKVVEATDLVTGEF